MFDITIVQERHYMLDCGVPDAEVDWLEAMKASGRTVSARTSMRAQRIVDQAYAGLVATITNPRFAVVQ
jgi:hypothetical protein